MVGDKENPIRASSLPHLLACPKSWMLRQGVTVSNEWAETGSLIHKGIDTYHKTNDADVAMYVMSLKREEFPQADPVKAAKHFLGYVERQSVWPKVTHTEEKVRFTLPGYEKGEEDIVIEGTLDQIRGDLLCDIKTGSPVASLMLDYHKPQLAAYQYGAFIRYGLECQAAIIRTNDLFTGGPLLHRASWSYDDVMEILAPIRYFISQVRKGKSVYIPGEECRICPAGGFELCSKGKVATFNKSITSITSIKELL